MDRVWIRAHRPGRLPFAAVVLHRFGNRLRIRDEEGRESVVLATDVLRPMHPSCFADVDDMAQLGDLQEFTILRNVHLRYKKNLIYTYTGNVLIAVNPYQNLPIYGTEQVSRYQNRVLGALPPHIFAVGDSSHQNARQGERKQCIIINGESGAGKTRSTKLLLQYYAAVAGDNSDVKEKILQSNPILEAFGNARTVRNDNSSRFGKYIAVSFNRAGNMEQAEIRQFLLEKSRIVKQCSGERNYHVFYLLLDGLSREEKDALRLKEIAFYKYLSQGDSTGKDTDDIVKFDVFREALKTLNFSEAEIWKTFELLAAILHLGNIDYEETQKFGGSAVEVADTVELRAASNLLGVPCHYLRSCLTRKKITLSDEVSKELNKREAMDTRDAFVKAIYGNLFQFVVGRINEAVRGGSATANGYIGLLDVFGFENLTVNSFEQLCINYANESLQQFFIRHTFKSEQGLYISEGIPWESIPFTDNDDVIDLISRAPANVLSILDDESKFPNGTDESFLRKVTEQLGRSPHILIPKFGSIPVFGIEHFAGAVLYEVEDFLEKNRDAYSEDYKNLARWSGNDFLKRIFAADLSPADRRAPGKKRMQTSSDKFKNSLEALLSELNDCCPFFIRCIKPNDFKEPNSFDRELCRKQLRYSGVLETSKIRQTGYAVRYNYTDFLRRYRVLEPNFPPVKSLTHDDLRHAAAHICQKVLGKGLGGQFGFTKVFLRNKEYLMLEKWREQILSRYIVVIQKAVRGWLQRKRYSAMKRGAVAVQKRWRARKVRMELNRTRDGIARLQAVIRSRIHRMFFLREIRIFARFQARCRGYVLRKAFREELRKRRELASRRPATDLGIAEHHPAYPPEARSKAAPTPEPTAPRPRPVKLDSYLHRHSKNDFVAYHLADVSKFVDDSFHFLDEPLEWNRHGATPRYM